MGYSLISRTFNPFSGITNNASESMNNVLKLHVNGEELPVDALVLSLQLLQYTGIFTIFNVEWQVLVRTNY